MTANGWFQIGLYVLVLFLVTKPIGIFLARVFEREKTFLDPLLRPVERLIYRICGVDENKEMRWTEYGTTMLFFSVVSLILLYLFERLQHWLPWNPQQFANVPPDLAWNTAVSFTTNTNWQAYTPEVTMSYLTQMAGLAYHNFASAAVGIALAIAVIRGVSRHESKTIGNFWVDLTRCFLWVLLPVCLVGSMVLVSQGRGPEPEALHHGTARRTANRANTGTGRQNGFANRNTASDRARSYGVSRSHQNVRYQWRWLFLREQLASLRKSDPFHKFFRDDPDFRDSFRLDLHPRPNDEIATPRLGRLGRNDSVVSRRREYGVLGGSAWKSGARGSRPDGERAPLRRKHGRKRGPIRHCEFGALCDGHNGRKLRRREQHARLLHAARRHGAAREYHAR